MACGSSSLSASGRSLVSRPEAVALQALCHGSTTALGRFPGSRGGIQTAEPCAVTRQSWTRLPMGSGSRASRDLVQTMSKPGRPGQQHGPFLGCHRPDQAPHQTCHHLQGRTTALSQLLSLLDYECAWASPKPCSPGHSCCSSSPLVPWTCCPPDAVGTERAGGRGCPGPPTLHSEECCL